MRGRGRGGGEAGDAAPGEIEEGRAARGERGEEERASLPSRWSHAAEISGSRLAVPPRLTTALTARSGATRISTGSASTRKPPHASRELTT